MKTLLITYDFPPIVSGIGTFFYNVWRLLPKEDNLILAAKVKGWQAVDSGPELNISRYIHPVDSAAVRFLIISAYTLILIVRKKINLIFCAVPLSIGVIGLVAKKIFKIPYVVFYYGGEFAKYRHRTVMFRIIKTVLCQADYVVANSSFTEQEVKLYGIKEEKIKKILPGVDAAAFYPLEKPAGLLGKYNLSNCPVILSVCRLVKRKGLDVVIESLVAVKKEFPDIRYLVIGSGPEKEPLKALALKLNLEKNVIFIPAVPFNELASYYNLCDLYVMPNRQTQGDETIEGFGISFIEASACAKAVIAGDSGGATEAVLDSITGIVVRGGNSSDLISAICRLLEDKNLRDNLGENGRRRILREFQWPQRAIKLQDLARKTLPVGT